MEEIKKKNKKLKKVAIILFIVIILLGGLDIFLYNEMMPIIDYAMVAESKQVETPQMFNAKLLEYCGLQKGSSVKALLVSVMSFYHGHNYSNRSVTINIKDGTLDDNNSITNFMSKIETKNKYEVNMYDSDNDDYIDKIFIRTEGEEATEEELKLEKNQITYDKWLEEQKELEEYEKELEERHKKEEKNKKIAIIVISILSIIGLILIIKGLIILKKDDENKKRKVLITFITTESIVVGGLLLVLIGIMTGVIYNF